MTPTQPLYRFDLGDKRLNARAARILQAALDHPGESIPRAAGDRAATDATYQFLDNPRVHRADLDNAHVQATRQRLAETSGPILLPQDTSDFDFTSPARARTLGQLAHAKHFGFFVHSALALRADGLPLGLLHQQIWMRSPAQRGKRAQRRNKATADKESQRWIDTEAACVAGLPADRLVVTLGDREADFYDLFAVVRRPLQHVLVRAKARRRIVGTKELLGVAVRQRPSVGPLTVAVPRRGQQAARQALLTVRYGTFALQAPSTHPQRKQLAPLPLQAVLVEEEQPPPGVAPLRWLLLTTLPVESFADAAQVVRWYCLRWRIERYHYTLKSGCQVEELQLETAERLQRALALYSMVATRLLYLRYQAELDEEAAGLTVVNAEEWEVLWRHFQPGQALPREVPGVGVIVRWIARLGGFLARKGDGAPGVKVLWRGLRQLHAMVVGFRLAKGIPHSE
jgi:Transposase DNA-binding/Transposase Tn5 dimerisation domain